MADDPKKQGKFGAVFKFEWLLTSILAGGMTVVIAIKLFDTPLLVAVLIGLIIALAGIALLAWLERSPTGKRIDRE